MHVLFFKPFHLIHLSLCIHLSEGIEDAFKTAATEVSLLAGTDEFNATELFGVGEILPPLVLLQTVPQMFLYYQRQFSHVATLLLHTLSILHAWAALCRDENVQQGRSTACHCTLILCS